MKKISVRLIAAVLAALLLCLAALADTGSFVSNAVPQPQVGSVGGEWAVIGLAQSGAAVPDGYFSAYHETADAYVKAHGAILDSRKYTENSRVILALTLTGKDARSVGGFDLTAALSDFKATTKQGLNGAIWALIALDSGAYPCAMRQSYVDEILRRQLPDGGWNLSKTQTVSDIDITAMALQALALYRKQAAVAAAIEKGVSLLQAQSVFTSSESAAQTVIALCTLGINPERQLQALEGFALPDGSYRHTIDGDRNQMATEQALLALTAAARLRSGKGALYLPDAPFRDLLFHGDRAAIEALAEKGVLNGRGDGIFDPNSTMTRAEFAAVMTRGLELRQKTTDAFSDVAEGAWYAPFVGAAYESGIITGRGAGVFDPMGTITRQEAALMVSRALSMRGKASIGGAIPAADADQVAPWAKDGVAACYAAGILDEKTMAPNRAILRCEVARMVYRLLEN